VIASMGRIVVADDQFINLEVLKNTLIEMKIDAKAQFCVNG
jgi:hypothetical protein